MGKLLKGICVVAASALTLAGLISFVHDSLVFIGLAKPIGDGPGGIIAGPIYMAVGGWLVWKAIRMPLRQG
jgi:hypothetical protein